MTDDDLSHLDLIVEREVPARTRKVAETASLADARDRNKALTVLLERLTDRVASLEDAVLDLTKQVETMEDRVLDGLQPLLLRRQDDVAMLKSTLTTIAADVQALRNSS